MTNTVVKNRRNFLWCLVENYRKLFIRCKISKETIFLQDSRQFYADFIYWSREIAL